LKSDPTKTLVVQRQMESRTLKNHFHDTSTTQIKKDEIVEEGSSSTSAIVIALFLITTLTIAICVSWKRFSMLIISYFICLSALVSQNKR